MKKLLTATTAILILFSLFLVSCEKQKPAAPAPPGGLFFAIDYKWTPPGEKEKKGTGNVAEGKTYTLIQLTPRILAGGCCAGGKWSYHVSPDNGVALYQDTNTGRLDFVSHYTGSFQVIISYTCPGGDTYPTIVTVEIVK